MKPMTIGKLAKAAGVSADTIRFYEDSGFLPKPDRLASGYRVYGSDSVRRLKFIAEAKALGFTLSEIMELIDLTSDEDADCAQVNEKATIKLGEINRKIAALKKMQSALKVLSERCPADKQPLSECSIINHFHKTDEHLHND